MHYDKTVYRPPLEAYTLLLQVTSGCSHNSCTYCSMYNGVTFKMSPMEEILQDLEEARMTTPNIERIYLLNGDPFVLSFDKLKHIAELVNEYLPNCKTITMYASISSVKNKSVEELKELRKLGINQLYFGIETGHDEILSSINKGNTASEAIEQLNKLKEANMDFISIIMYGVGGKDKGEENAIKTAELLNSVSSLGIFLMNLNVLPNTPLFDEMQRGEFVEASEVEKLIELRKLIEKLEVKRDTFITSMHMSNYVPINGSLPQDKDKILKDLDEAIKAGQTGELQFEKRQIR